jgi:hypothetical protein
MKSASRGTSRAGGEARWNQVESLAATDLERRLVDIELVALWISHRHRVVVETFFL